jgi:beta-phosphoglucomutase family hydrolase
MFQAVIFDMDGLMIDSERLHHRSFADVLGQYGVTPELNEKGIAHIQGISAGANWERFKKLYRFEADTRELTKKKQEIQLTLLCEGVSAMPGLIKLLQDLRKHHFKTAVASSSTRAHIDLVIKSLSISSLFDALTSGDEVVHGKPDPDIFLKAASKLGVDPKSCVVLEDAVHGIRAAKAANMYAIAVPNEFTEYEDFSIADMVIPSLEVISGRMLQGL